MKNLKQFLVLSATILVFAFYFGFNHPASSNSADNVSGYAWEADDGGGVGGMGWLSFNCISGGNCATSDYGVSIDGSGNMSGYSWSSNYGWIKFGGLSNFPSGEGTQAQNANLNGNNLKGWARFCAVATSGCDFSSLKPDSATRGWDGWVSLSGAGYGVTINQTSGVFSDYAWGGPDMVGWIDFSQVKMSVDNEEPKLFLKANNNNDLTKVEVGDVITLSSTGYGLDTTSGEATGSWSGGKACPDSLTSPGTVYTPSFKHSTPGTYRYTLTCDSAEGGGTISDYVDVVVLSSLDDYCTDNPIDPICISIHCESYPDDPICATIPPDQRQPYYREN